MRRRLPTAFELPIRGIAALAALILAASAVPSLAAAQPDTIAVIEPGREAEIVALFRPIRLTQEIDDGYRLMNIRVESTDVVCEVVGPDDERATLTLAPLDVVEHPDATTASFAVTRSAQSRPARRALDRLIELLSENDAGGFYHVHASATPGGLDRRTPMIGSALPWLFDGALWCLAFALLLVMFVVRELRRSSRATALWLVGIVVANAAVRVALAPHTVLGAWPFSRTTAIMQLIWRGPSLALLSTWLDRPLGWFEVVTTTTLAFACATPLAIFLHAKKLLGTDRLAIVAALVVAALPNHVRFSHSEVEFIPSIALSSYAFALTHIALKDSEGAFRRVALLALPVVVASTFLTRPLNQIYLPLLLFTALYLSRKTAPLGRRILASVVIVAMAAWVLVEQFWPYYQHQVSDGLDLQTIAGAAIALFTPRWNTLINFWITPPGMTLLAITGAWLSVRGPRREVTLYLLGWLLLFFVAHAYVLPEEAAMQARYHLHLVVPFCMLVALGVDALFRYRRLGAQIATAYIAFAPLMHIDFVRDAAFNDPLEYMFLDRARHTVPDGCTVLEYAGAGEGEVDLRFGRLGAVVEGRTERRLYTAIPIGAAADLDDPLLPAVRTIVSDPPECLVYYEGLFCYGRKDRDEPIARACAEMRTLAPLEPLDAMDIANRPYDGNLAMGLKWPENDGERELLRLTVYRVRPRR